ncbi:MAG: hypothetical protein IPM42_03290 [Saprospiraceae bacterium]|nr:hypothetical protein [Saprospiraceae bacterium]
MKRTTLSLTLLCFCILLSAQSIKGRRNNQNNPKKEISPETESTVDDFKKYTFYMSRVLQKYNVESVERWARVSTYFEPGDRYYSTQTLEKHEFIFNPLMGLNLGLNRNIKLNKSWSVSYGLGVEFFSFTFSSSVSELEERIINRFDVIKQSSYTPGEIKVTKINPEIVSDNSERFSEFKGEVEYKNIALNLPFSLQYEVFKNFNISGNVGLILPIASSVSGIKYNYYTGNYLVITNTNDKSVSRVLLNVGMGLHYHIDNKFSVGINYRSSLNSVFATDNSTDMYSDNLPESNVNLSAFEVRMGYCF